MYRWKMDRVGPPLFNQFAGPFAPVLGTRAEGVEKGPVLGAEVEIGLRVGGVDKGCGLRSVVAGRLCGSCPRMAVTNRRGCSATLTSLDAATADVLKGLQDRRACG